MVIREHFLFQIPRDHLAVGPLRGVETPFVACATLIPNAASAIWMLAAIPDTVSREHAAVAAAIVAVHSRAPLVHPILHPRKSALGCAIVLPDGRVGDLRGAFPSSIVAALQDVAGLLISRHPEYVDNLLLALKGNQVAAFQPLPKGLPIADPANECSWAPRPPDLDFNSEAFQPYNDPEILFHLAAHDYRTERYLEQLNDEELAARAADALRSVYNFEKAGVFLVDAADPRVVAALVRCHEATAEYRIRNPAGWQELIAKLVEQVKLPDSKGPTVGRAMEWIETLRGRPLTGFAKYGRKEHMEELFHHGRVRFTPASYYSDPSLNQARNAQELVFEVPVDLKRTRIEIRDETNTPSLGFVEPVNATTSRAARDLYVFCASQRISARMFFDFEADACVLVTDREEFMRRLAAALATAAPDHELLACNVEYVDTFAPDARRASPLTHKPIRYDYQCEHRLLLVPPRDSRPEGILTVELGSLHDVATFFSL